LPKLDDSYWKISSALPLHSSFEAPRKQGKIVDVGLVGLSLSRIDGAAEKPFKTPQDSITLSDSERYDGG